MLLSTSAPYGRDNQNTISHSSQNESLSLISGAPASSTNGKKANVSGRVVEVAKAIGNNSTLQKVFHVVKTIVFAFVNPFEANKTLRRFTDLRQDGACSGKNAYVTRNRTATQEDVQECVQSRSVREGEIKYVQESVTDNIDDEDGVEEARDITPGSKAAGLVSEVVLFPLKFIENVALMVIGVPVKVGVDAIAKILSPAKSALTGIGNFLSGQRSTLEKVLIGLACLVVLGAAVAILVVTAKITIPLAIVITLVAIGVTAYIIRREMQICDLQDKYDDIRKTLQEIKAGQPLQQVQQGGFGFAEQD